MGVVPEEELGSRPVRDVWIFLLSAVSRVRVCVKVQPLLKGDKVRSVHDGEATVQNLRQQGDENTDAGIGRRWKNYYFI